MHSSTIRSLIAVSFLVLAAVAVAADQEEFVILKAIYLPVEGSDVEYGQGAIERNELSHAPLSDTEWLIRVESSRDTSEWQARLNRSVEARHGSFRVDAATQEELERVASGAIAFQQ